MDDTLQIIIYALILVASLVGSAVKKYKKVNSTPPPPTTNESPWEWHEEQSDEPYAPSTWTVPVPVPVPNPVETRQAMDMPPRYGSKDDGKARASNTELQRIVASEGGRTTLKTPPQSKISKLKHKHQPTEEEQQHETEDILADFDLRHAVIYSEILKPKFDEY